MASLSAAWTLFLQKTCSHGNCKIGARLSCNFRFVQPQIFRICGFSVYSAFSWVRQVKRAPRTAYLPFPLWSHQRNTHSQLVRCVCMSELVKFFILYLSNLSLWYWVIISPVILICIPILHSSSMPSLSASLLLLIPSAATTLYASYRRDYSRLNCLLCVQAISLP